MMLCKNSLGQLISFAVRTLMHRKGNVKIWHGNEMKAAPFYLVYQGISAKLILNGH
jgi:hypothetical protein